MSAARAVINILVNNAGVSAFVGNRVLPNRAYMSVPYPQVLYRIKDTEYPARTYTSNGGLGVTPLELLVISTSATEREEVADAIVAALDNQSGVWNNIQVQGCFLRDMSDDVVDNPNSEEILYYLKEMSFEINYTL